MDLGLKDKVIFVAGASRGIGRATAESFAREGARVAITARTEASLEEARSSMASVAGEERVLAVRGDMTKSDDISRALDMTETKLGPLHCAVANVGIGNARQGIDVSDGKWDADIAQNLTGSMFLAREAVKRMLRRPMEARTGASIIFISSIAGVQAFGTPIPYAVSKAAINHAGKVMAKLLGKEGIRVNVIAPGNILFPGSVWDKNLKTNPDVWMRWIKRDVAMKRFGKVEEMADTILWLASDRASFITGVLLPVDGGQLR